MSSAAQPAQLSDVLLFEEDSLYSRNAVSLLDGSDVDYGTVLGKIASDAAGGVTADAGNTGDADVSGVAVTIGAAAQVGAYTLTCTAESANAGTFSVVAPDGTVLPDLTVASAYASSHISLTIPDGAEDWDIDDILTVTITGRFTNLDDTASDGTQTVAGIAIGVAAPSGADGEVVALLRHAVVKKSGLVWPATADAAEQTTGITQLEALGIMVRSDA